MIARIDDDGARLFAALIINDPISRTRIARLGLRCYATCARAPGSKEMKARRVGWLATLGSSGRSSSGFATMILAHQFLGLSVRSKPRPLASLMPRH
jgi:hypothetical protein